MKTRYGNSVLLWTAGVGSTVLVVVASSFLIRRAVPEGPRLSLDRGIYDFGIVPPGESLVAKFQLTNTGPRLLEVSDLETSCGCAPAEITSPTIAPNGGKATISVAVKAPIHPGQIGHSVSFRTNDPHRDPVRLQIQGRAQWAVEASPATLWTGQILYGAHATRSIELFSSDTAPFEVSAVEASVPWIQVERTTPSGRARRHRFRVTIAPAAPPRALLESLSFTTSRAERPTVVVPVTGEVVTQQRIGPKRLLLASSAPGAITEGRLIVRSEEQSPEIKEASARDDAWKVESSTLEAVSDGTWLLRLRIRVPEQPGYNQTVLLVSDRSQGTTYRIPTSCLVRATAAN